MTRITATLFIALGLALVACSGEGVPMRRDAAVPTTHPYQDECDRWHETIRELAGIPDVEFAAAVRSAKDAYEVLCEGHTPKGVTQ